MLGFPMFFLKLYIGLACGQRGHLVSLTEPRTVCGQGLFLPAGIQSVPCYGLHCRKAQQSTNSSDTCFSASWAQPPYLHFQCGPQCLASPDLHSHPTAHDREEKGDDPTLPWISYPLWQGSGRGQRQSSPCCLIWISLKLGRVFTPSKKFCEAFRCRSNCKAMIGQETSRTKLET